MLEIPVLMFRSSAVLLKDSGNGILPPNRMHVPDICYVALTMTTNL
jgi:hypothetical protein